MARAHWMHRRLVAGVGEAVENPAQVLDVLQVEGPVTAQVGERRLRQAQRPLDLVGGAHCQCHAGAFEHVDHAEEAHRIPALHRVPGVGDHRVGGRRSARGRGRVAVAARGLDVVQDPVVVADLFLQVVQRSLAQSRVPVRADGRRRP